MTMSDVLHSFCDMSDYYAAWWSCEGFHVNAPACGSQWYGSNEQGQYCSSGSAAIGSLKTAM